MKKKKAAKKKDKESSDEDDDFDRALTKAGLLNKAPTQFDSRKFDVSFLSDRNRN